MDLTEGGVATAMSFTILSQDQAAGAGYRFTAYSGGGACGAVNRVQPQIFPPATAEVTIPFADFGAACDFTNLGALRLSSTPMASPPSTWRSRRSRR